MTEWAIILVSLGVLGYIFGSGLNKPIMNKSKTIYNKIRGREI